MKHVVLLMIGGSRGGDELCSSAPPMDLLSGSRSAAAAPWWSRGRKCPSDACEAHARRRILPSPTKCRLAAEELLPRGHIIRVFSLFGPDADRSSPPAVAACKDLIQRAREGDITSAYASERESCVKLFDTLDQTEGVRSFLEKRKPVWRGR